MTQNTYKGKYKIENKSKIKNKSKTKKNKKTTPRTKKRGLHGGFKLGEGGFGCVISPYIPCSKKELPPTTTYISKIIQSNFKDYREEVKLLNKIKKIDPNNKFLISFDVTCELKDTDVKNRTSSDDILRVKYNTIANKISNNKFKILDKDVDDKLKKEEIEDEYCKFDPRLQYFNQIQILGGKEFNFYFKLSKEDLNYKLFKNNCRYIFKYLLTGLKLLHKNKIVHRDIKPQNILIKIVDNKLYPRFIDFGLSTDFNEEYEIIDIGHRQGTTTYIPIDIYMAYMIIKLIHKQVNVFMPIGFNILKTKINKIYVSKYKSYYSKNKLNKSFLKFKSSTEKDNLVNSKEYVNSEDIHNLLIKLLIQYKNSKLLSNHKMHYDGYMYKADVFALGLTFKQFHDSLKINDNKLENLIKHMLQANPDKRYNVNQCLKHISLRSINI